MKIYTVTPNPALDLSGHVHALVPNEKNYIFDERRDPGGNGINSARVIRRLGGDVLALGFLGGATGSEIRAMLAQERVACDFVRVAAATRTNVTVTNDCDHQQTRLTFPGPRVTRTEVLALERRVAKLRGPGILVLGGSVPEGVRPDFLLKLARLGARAGLGVVIDVPAKFLRTLKPRGWRPLLLKPNDVELAEFAGRPLRTQAALLEAAGELQARSGAGLVCVSLGAKGALLRAGTRAWRGTSPRVKPLGTVGAGDSMVGAMVLELARQGISQHAQVAAWSRGEGPARVLRWGLAAGAATAETRGTALARASEVLRLSRRAKAALLKDAAR